MEQASFFAIGDPGRAARELPPGPPPAHVGPADVELSTASLQGMLIHGVSCRGLEHRARWTVRQDAFALGHRARGAEAIAVVCDGVGSLDRSEDAAVLVSRRLAQLGADGLSWPDAFAQANEELRKVAGEADQAGDGGMATTAVAVTLRCEAGEWAGEAAWVGDSSLWHLSSAGVWTPLTGPPLASGEAGLYSSGVKALPSDDGACTWCGFRIGGGALFVMTDGVSNPLRWSREVRDALAEWWRRAPEALTFAAQVGFARKSHMDDRTVVGIWADGGDVDAAEESEPRAADPSG